MLVYVSMDRYPEDGSEKRNDRGRHDHARKPASHHIKMLWIWKFYAWVLLKSCTFEHFVCCHVVIQNVNSRFLYHYIIFYSLQPVVGFMPTSQDVLTIVGYTLLFCD